ncbi:MAG: Ppx/GppA family phosphatase [Bacteroidetes bacterium]|jgi:exopolyphosphatase/guanosine-5'-triphosphate,3'-diphosphate pyrophosphatase|nr:Ppx/GppA family phosphatase [Bacteroidota bacterium]
MRIAAIDIGTNTVLMLVADLSAERTVSVVRDEHAIARLGQGVDRERRISPEALRRADDTLRHHLALASDLKVDRIVAVGTSALRDAANRDGILAHWQKEFGIDVQVIPSEEEARLTFLGVFAGTRTGDGMHAVLDIGGGSTEFTLGRDGGVIDRFSVDLGAVRLTERFWESFPPAHGHLKEARQQIRQTLLGSRSSLPRARWYAVAGTPTTLAAIAQSLTFFDPAAIDGFRLTRSYVSEAAASILTLTHDELLRHPQIHPQRADIMGAGVLILEGVMQLYGLEDVTVSVRGLRYGVALTAT